MKNFYLKATADGRKTRISASSNEGMGINIFVKDQNNLSKEVVFINCFKTTSGSLEIEVFAGNKTRPTRIIIPAKKENN